MGDDDADDGAQQSDTYEDVTHESDLGADQTYTEVTNQSWFSRLGQSIKSVLVGLLLFVVAFPLLFWNEGRAVQRARSLEKGESIVVSLPGPKVDPANEGKLVHVTGKATTNETLSDAMFGVSKNAIKLIRKVSMYQWKESSTTRTEKRMGGGTRRTTTYSYSRVWSDRPISSIGFKKSAGHQNPGSMPVPGQELVARNVTLGGFALPARAVQSIDKTVPVGLKTLDKGRLPAAVRDRADVGGGAVYIGANPAAPKVGDARVEILAVPPTEVSLIAKQVKNTFEPYDTGGGSSLFELQTGVHSAKEMFKAARKANVMQTWALRLAGFVIMGIGIAMVFNPLAVVADVLPFLGDLLRLGVAVFAFVVALALSMVTVAVAWFYFRPLYSVLLIVVAVALFFAVRSFGKGKREAARAAA